MRAHTYTHTRTHGKHTVCSGLRIRTQDFVPVSTLPLSCISDPWCFETGSCHVAEAGLEFIFRHQPLKSAGMTVMHPCSRLIPHMSPCDLWLGALCLHFADEASVEARLGFKHSAPSLPGEDLNGFFPPLLTFYSSADSTP